MADSNVVVGQQAYERALTRARQTSQQDAFDIREESTNPLPVMPMSAMTMSSLLNWLIWAMPASVMMGESWGI
jgi:hypothetical protein